MEKGYTVPVKLEPEPDNFWDPNAIAFVLHRSEMDKDRIYSQ